MSLRGHVTEPDATLRHDGWPCLSEHTIAAFVAGSLEPGRLEVIDAHTQQCEACFALIAASAAVADSWEVAGGAAASELAPAGALRLLSSRFEPIEIIARGGTSVVYLGWDWLAARPVAIKRLEPGPGKEAREYQFSVEAELLARLDHPNIVRLVASIPRPGGRDIVLEYAEGSLRDLLRRDSFLGLERALTLVSKLCDGLAQVHDAGIVHRDLKPDNVLISAADVPLLADFGSAQLIGAVPLGGIEIVGTVAYLSPEAARGCALDARADLWALGVMLFEMLSGERPFRGRSQRGTLRAVLDSPTPQLRRNLRGTPPALVSLVENLLEKDRDRRLPSARQLGAEIRSILRNIERTRAHYPSPAEYPATEADSAATQTMPSGSGRFSIHGSDPWDERSVPATEHIMSSRERRPDPVRSDGTSAGSARGPCPAPGR